MVVKTTYMLSFTTPFPISEIQILSVTEAGISEYLMNLNTNSLGTTCTLMSVAVFYYIIRCKKTLIRIGFVWSYMCSRKHVYNHFKWILFYFLKRRLLVDVKVCYIYSHKCNKFISSTTRVCVTRFQNIRIIWNLIENVPM